MIKFIDKNLISKDTIVLIGFKLDRNGYIKTVKD